MKRLTVPLTVLLGTLAIPTIADAQYYDYDSDNRYDPYDMAFTVGGSFSDYLREEARSFTSPGGGWEARAVFGTRSYLGAEAAYVASLNGMTALGVDDNARLMSNGAEGLARVNFTTSAWQPYVLAGLGWRHYNVVNTDVNTSSIDDTADAMVIPVALGISYRVQRMVMDLRGTYRPSFLDDISAAQSAPLDSASAAFNVGFEF